MIKIERLGVRVLEKNLNNDEEEYITIDLGGNTENTGKRTSRRTKNKKLRGPQICSPLFSSRQFLFLQYSVLYSVSFY